MTKYQREKQALLDAGINLDKKADEIVGQGETILGNVKKSKWTAAALAGATVAGLVAAYYIIK